MGDGQFNELREQLREQLRQSEVLAADRLVLANRERRRFDVCERELKATTEVRASFERRVTLCEAETEQLSGDLKSASAEHQTLENETHNLHGQVQELEAFVEDA